jgi:hypothetical protein
MNPVLPMVDLVPNLCKISYDLPWILYLLICAKRCTLFMSFLKQPLGAGVVSLE